MGRSYSEVAGHIYFAELAFRWEIMESPPWYRMIIKDGIKVFHNPLGVFPAVAMKWQAFTVMTGFCSLWELKCLGCKLLGVWYRKGCIMATRCLLLTCWIDWPKTSKNNYQQMRAQTVWPQYDCMYVYMYVCTYVCLYVTMSVCMYVYGLLYSWKNIHYSLIAVYISWWTMANGIAVN